jgi:hypothetical protein
VRRPRRDYRDDLRFRFLRTGPRPGGRHVTTSSVTRPAWILVAFALAKSWPTSATLKARYKSIPRPSSNASHDSSGPSSIRRGALLATGDLRGITVMAPRGISNPASATPHPGSARLTNRDRCDRNLRQ